MQGKVVSLNLGNAKIVAQGETYLCNVRGNLRKFEDVKVGDDVEFDPNFKVVLRLLSRKNQLTRPSVSNVDQVLICISSLPKPNLSLVDILIAEARVNGIEPIICITKKDIVDDDFLLEIKSQFSPLNIKIIETSVADEKLVNKIFELIKGKTTVLAGQSGVGKSSLINAINKDLNLKTNLLTKFNTGKNTTTSANLYNLNDNTFVLDTAGFSVLELNSNLILIEQVYPEIYQIGKKCKYRSCNHKNMKNDDCAVANALKTGLLNKNRYARFLKLTEKLEKLKNKKYKREK